MGASLVIGACSPSPSPGPTDSSAPTQDPDAQVRADVAAAAETVAPGGFLLYTTCTFSQRENEGAIEKLLATATDFTPVEVPHLDPLRSAMADFPAYRVYPHLSPGAGGFSALLRRAGTSDTVPRPPLPPPLLDYPVKGPSSGEET